MDSEVVAALAGGVVGAVAVGIVGHFERVYRERSDSKAAFQVFSYFHKKCMGISCDRNGLANKFDMLVPTLNDVTLFVVEKGSTGIRESFLEYLVEFAHLRESERSTPGQSHHKVARMKNIFSRCASELTSEGLLSPLDNDEE